MDKSAVQEIVKLAVNAGALLEENNAAIIPDGYKLQSLEHLQLRPYLFRGLFSTNLLNEFAGYVNAYGNSDTSVFIDQQSMSALAVIDQGSQEEPKWGRHKAKIELLATPAYSAILKRDNNPLLQQDFIDFAEDWQENIQFYFTNEAQPDAYQPTLFKQTIKTLRKLKVSATASKEQSVGNFSASQSALESIEVKAGNEDIPAGFLFNVTPYEGFDPITLDCQLRAVNDEKSVKLKYRIGQLGLIEERIANQFREKLNVEINAKELSIALFIGKMSYQQ